MADNTADVVVVGAGAVGCAIAYYLSLEGLSVRLMDREAIGSGASAHATGVFSMLGGEFRPGASAAMALEGLQAGKALFPRLEEEAGVKVLYQELPEVRIALDEDEERLIHKMMAWQSKQMEVRWIDGDEVLKIEPRLNPNVRGAVVRAGTVQLDSYRFTLALAQGAEKHGASIHIRQATGLSHQKGRVTGVTYDGGTVACKYVVLALGAWAGICQRWLNLPVPVRPLRGERLLLQYEGPSLPVLLFSPKRGHIMTRADGYWSVGSTGGRDYDQAENFLEEEFDRRPTEEAKMELLERALHVLPALEDARVYQQLAGSRPASADRMPIIGPVPGWEGVLLAVGHTTKGIHLAPVTGVMVRDFILHGKPRVGFDFREFLPERFAGQWQPKYLSATHHISKA